MNDDDDDDDDVREQHNTTTQTRKKERKKEKRLPQKRMRDLSKRLVSRRSRLSSLVFFCGVLLSPPLLKKEKERQKATF